MFRITKDPSSGSDNLYFEITCNGSQTFIMCVVGVWRHCEPLQVTSVKVQVITPWRWNFYNPKHVGVIFNYVSFKLLYDIDFNIYVLYNWVH